MSAGVQADTERHTRFDACPIRAAAPAGAAGPAAPAALEGAIEGTHVEVIAPAPQGALLCALFCVPLCAVLCRRRGTQRKNMSEG